MDTPSPGKAPYTLGNSCLIILSYSSTTGNYLDGHKWYVSTIKLFWSFLHSFWTHRNAIVHGSTADAQVSSFSLRFNLPSVDYIVPMKMTNPSYYLITLHCLRLVPYSTTPDELVWCSKLLGAVSWGSKKLNNLCRSQDNLQSLLGLSFENFSTHPDSHSDDSNYSPSGMDMPNNTATTPATSTASSTSWSLHSVSSSNTIGSTMTYMTSPVPDTITYYTIFSSSSLYSISNDNRSWSSSPSNSSMKSTHDSFLGSSSSSTTTSCFYSTTSFLGNTSGEPEVPTGVLW